MMRSDAPFPPAHSRLHPRSTEATAFFRRLGLCQLFFLIILLTPGMAAPQAPEDPRLQAAAREIGTTPEALFLFVRDRIKPTLNRRALQSPTQVLATRHGNPGERARLLAALLAAGGHPARLQTGTLAEDKIALLIQSAFPPDPPTRTWPADIPLSAPLEDPELTRSLRRHTWVQVLTRGRWLDLDPAFPGAAMGVRHAEADTTFYRFSASRLPTLELTLESNRVFAEDFEELLWWDGPLENIAGQPLSLRIYPRITLSTSDRQDELDPARRLVDPLTGADTAKAEPVTVTTWRAELFLGDQILAGEDLPDSIAEGGRIRSLRLRSRIIFSEDDVIEDRRLLAEPDQTGKFPLFQRHTLLLTSSTIGQGELDRWLCTLPPERRTAIKKELEHIHRDLTAGQMTPAPLLEGSLAGELTVGGFSGHFLNLAYTVISDQMSADLAKRLGVHAWFDDPRLIITSVITKAHGHQRLMLDLRRDCQSAIALAGQPRRLNESYQFGRGVMTSALEGRLISQAGQTPALTTAVLMRLAQSQGIGARLFSARERHRLDALNLPATVRSRLDDTLEAGQIVLLPLKPVFFDGQMRWGWWQIDPISHHMIGVLDSGLHQAVIERTLIETEGVLSNEMAAVIGAISGATDTQFVISAMVLKHGELNAEALAEAKEYMTHLGEALCQELTVELKAEVSRTLASASVEVEGCFRHEQSLEVGGGAGGSLTLMDKGWCEAFQRGFTCSSMTILNAYREQ